MVWTESEFLAVGTLGFINTFSDGPSWSEGDIGGFGASELSGLTRFGSRIVATSSSGGIVTRP